MSRVAIVDDDYSVELLSEQLATRGHAVIRVSSIDEAIQRVAELASSDLVVLDIIMPPSVTYTSPIYGGIASGLSIYKEIRKISATVPIFVYSATSDPQIIKLLRRDAHVIHLSKWNTPTLSDVVTRIERKLNSQGTSARLRAFIVHGHDEVTKLAVKNYLQNTLNFEEPIVLHEQPSMGRTIIEKFEEYAHDVDYVFVLLTPDDVVAADGPNDTKRRARQNVIFEMGYFYGCLGRRSGKVFLLYAGSLELPSDIAGIIYIDISNGIDSAGERIRRELRNER